MQALNHACKHAQVITHAYTHSCKHASTRTPFFFFLHAQTHTLLGNHGDRCPRFRWSHKPEVAAEHKQHGKPLVCWYRWVWDSGCSECLTGPQSPSSHPENSGGKQMWKLHTNITVYSIACVWEKERVREGRNHCGWVCAWCSSSVLFPVAWPSVTVNCLTWY